MEIEQKPEGVEMSTLNEQSKQQEFVPPVENGVFQEEKTKERLNIWRILSILSFILIIWRLISIYILPMFLIIFKRNAFMGNIALEPFVVAGVWIIVYAVVLFFSLKAFMSENYIKATLLNIAPVILPVIVIVLIMGLGG